MTFLKAFTQSELGREILRTIRFHKPHHETKPKLIAPVISEHPSRVGVAFDYLMRWYLERQYPQTARHEHGWLSDTGLTVIDRMHEHTVNPPEPKNGARIMPSTLPKISKSERDTIFKASDDARTTHDTYVSAEGGERTSDKMLTDIAAAAWTVSGLTAAARGAVAHMKNVLVPPAKTDIEDLSGLYRVLEQCADVREYLDGATAINLAQNFHYVPVKKDEKHIFERHEHLIPETRDMGRLQGEADIMSNDMIIDIKVLKNYSFGIELFDQLCGYAALAGRLGVDVKRVGIYFARHSVLDVVETPNVDWISLYEKMNWGATMNMCSSGRHGPHCIILKCRYAQHIQKLMNEGHSNPVYLTDPGE